MAFNISNLSFGRGGINNHCPAGSLAKHRYNSDTDNFATIQTAGYFPPYLGGTQDEVKEGDLLTILDSSGAYLDFELTSLSPVVILTTLVGAGDVSGPASSTLNSFARFSDTTGKIIKDSPNATMNDAGDIQTAGTITATGTIFTDILDDNGSGFLQTDAKIKAAAGLQADQIEAINPGPITFLDGIVLPNGAPAVFDTYTEVFGTFSSISGFAVSPTSDFFASRVGDQVSLTFATFNGSNVVNSVVTMGTPGQLGAILTPSANRFCSYTAHNLNAVDGFSGVEVTTGGQIVIYYSPTGGFGLFPGLTQPLTINTFTINYTV
jgi:hypothetical protein